MRRSLIAFILLALCASSDARGTLSPRAMTSGQDAGLPDDLGQLYATLDRADLGQYRELFAPASALAAIKQGKPLPAGTVLTLVVYSAKRDDAGHPIEDAKGRYIKGITITTTMGPGIHVDPTRTRDIAEAPVAEAATV